MKKKLYKNNLTNFKVNIIFIDEKLKNDDSHEWVYFSKNKLQKNCGSNCFFFLDKILFATGINIIIKSTTNLVEIEKNLLILR